MNDRELHQILDKFGQAVTAAAHAAHGSPVGVETTWLREFLAASRRGEFPRRGSLPGQIRYTVHGAGVRFEFGDGRLVDVDLDASTGDAIFDSWRLESFARSAGLDLDSGSLSSALQEAVSTGSFRVTKPGWFAVVRSGAG